MRVVASAALLVPVASGNLLFRTRGSPNGFLQSVNGGQRNNGTVTADDAASETDTLGAVASYTGCQKLKEGQSKDAIKILGRAGTPKNCGEMCLDDKVLGDQIKAPTVLMADGGQVCGCMDGKILMRAFHHVPEDLCTSEKCPDGSVCGGNVVEQQWSTYLYCKHCDHIPTSPPIPPTEVAFTLQGLTGREKVRIKIPAGELSADTRDTGDHIEEHTLGPEPRLFTFDVPHTAHDKLFVTFLNDEGPGMDVILKFEDPVHRRVDIKLNTGNWKSWDCEHGGRKQDKACYYVRSGRFYWNGEYEITLPNKRQREQYAERDAGRDKGNEIHFQLKGKSGQEVVHLDIGDRSDTVVMEKGWMDFFYPKPPGGHFKIEFMNDRGHINDVWFKPQGPDKMYMELPRNFRGWNCDQGRENKRCGMVRKGEMQWQGVYDVSMKKPEIIKFQLKGRRGPERVRVQVGGSNRSFGLWKGSWKTFRYKKPGKNEMIVEFKNDGWRKDVFFRTKSGLPGVDIELPRKWGWWRCNKRRFVNKRCGWVKQGKFLWNGDYVIKW